MRLLAPTSGVAALLCGYSFAWADNPAAPSPPADERLVFSADGGSLTGGSGAGGGALTWLRNVGSGVIGLGGEYQSVANAHWILGNLSASVTLGPGDWKTSLYADAHEGAGDIGAHAFHYSIVDGGLLASLGPIFSVQLEERRIDIDTSHGHLPKLGVSLRMTPQLTGSVSYAQSFGGNLDTKLKTVRLDYAGKVFNWLAGYAWGPASPAVINLVGQVVAPAGPLKEGVVGVGKSFGRTDWQLRGDYQNLNGFKRGTVTLVCTLHLGARS